MKLYDKGDGLVRFEVGDRVKLRKGKIPEGFDSPLTGVMHKVDKFKSGGLVKHDDGKIYGWSAMELEYLPPKAKE
tara:strand:- start:5997 stop:6221 length:225 start_codon:yes stop_codon:yes gene_type:complete